MAAILVFGLLISRLRVIYEAQRFLARVGLDKRQGESVLYSEYYSLYEGPSFFDRHFKTSSVCLH